MKKLFAIGAFVALFGLGAGSALAITCPPGYTACTIELITSSGTYYYAACCA